MGTTFISHKKCVSFIIIGGWR